MPTDDGRGREHRGWERRIAKSLRGSGSWSTPFASAHACTRRGTAFGEQMRVTTSTGPGFPRGEAIEHGGCHLGVAEHLRPIGESQIGGDQERRVLIEFADQVEQQLSAGLTD